MTVIYYKKRNLVFLLIGILLLVGACIYSIIEHWIVDAPMSPDMLARMLRNLEISSFWVATVSALFFSAALIIILKELLYKGPAVIIDSTGITIPKQKKFIAWDEFNHAKIENKLIMVYAKNPKSYPLILPITLTMKQKEIEEVIMRYYLQFLKQSE